jgi:hypothetical protein
VSGRYVPFNPLVLVRPQTNAKGNSYYSTLRPEISGAVTMTFLTTSSTAPNIARLKTLAIEAITEADLQVPSCTELNRILICSLHATALLEVAAICKPTQSELDEMFQEFVTRAVNRAPGINDVAN